MKLFKKKAQRVYPKTTIQTDESGKQVLRKTVDYRMSVIRDSDDEVIGSILLTEEQHSILNEVCNPKGIHFTRK